MTGDPERPETSRAISDLPEGVDPDGDRVDGWPVELRGVTESVIATLGPNGRWNHAALGLHAPDDCDGGVTARTIGRTRTWRNLREQGSGFVQFVADPLAFTEAALGIYETDAPVVATADAWVEVEAIAVDEWVKDDTAWIEWKLRPKRAGVRGRQISTINRGRAAVIEATVAASRLDVDAYDETMLLDRLSYLADVVEACGGDRERLAFDRIDELTGWRSRLDAR